MHRPVNSMLDVEFHAFITPRRRVEPLGNLTDSLCVAARGAMD